MTVVLSFDKSLSNEICLGLEYLSDLMGNKKSFVNLH